MPGGFRIKVTITKPNMFALIVQRLQDGFAELFEAIIERWQEHNDEKFEQAQGASLSGLDFDGDVSWDPLTPDYFETKSEDYDDWLMVRDGDLLESLTNPGAAGWFEQITPRSARFGTTLPQAGWNWDKRPTMFLDEWDRDMIRDLAFAFLDGKAPFKAWTPSATQVLEAEFANMMELGST